MLIESLEPRAHLSASTADGQSLAPTRVTAAAAAASTVHQTSKIAAKEISESSGVVAGRAHAGVFFTHNDSGKKSLLYAITADGTLVGRYVLNVKTTDWEDIAADASGHLYVADTGDNDAEREVVTVYRIAEPAPSTAKHVAEHKVKAQRMWRLRYPGGAHADSEAFFVAGDSGYLITKRKDGGKAAMYRFPLAAGNKPRTLERVTTLGVTRPVTAADLSPDGRRLAVTSTGALYVYDLPAANAVATVGRLSPRTFALPDRQIEAVTFVRRGKGLLLTAESREIYQLAL
jgi:hypothetical protein